MCNVHSKYYNFKILYHYCNISNWNIVIYIEFRFDISRYRYFLIQYSYSIFNNDISVGYILYRYSILIYWKHWRQQKYWFDISKWHRYNYVYRLLLLYFRLNINVVLIVVRCKRTWYFRDPWKLSWSKYAPCCN